LFFYSESFHVSIPSDEQSARQTKPGPAAVALALLRQHLRYAAVAQSKVALPSGISGVGGSKAFGDAEGGLVGGERHLHARTCPAPQSQQRRQSDHNAKRHYAQSNAGDRQVGHVSLPVRQLGPEHPVEMQEGHRWVMRRDGASLP